MTTYNITPVTVAVHPVGENPVFSEQAVHVSISDDGGGPFLTLMQYDSTMVGEIKVGFDGFDALVDAVTLLKAGMDKVDFA